MAAMGSMISGVAPAAPAQVKFSRIRETCMSTGDAREGVQPAMSACMAAEIGLQSIELNETYKVLASNLSPPDKIVLRDSERAWIKRRDAKCNRLDTGGQLDHFLKMECLASETISRTQWLKHYR